MADTQIEWTDKVWNAVTGCSKVSQGCKHCYAETVAERFFAKQYPPNPDGSPRKFTDVRCHEDRLDAPLHWRKPQRVFVNSMSDLFHESVPFEFIRDVWGVCGNRIEHTFQILTKRPARMLEFAKWMAGDDDISIAEWPRNCWLGVSCEDQKTADERIPLLLQTPAAVRWISAEPLLGPINISGWLGVMVPNGEGGHVVFEDDKSGSFDKTLSWVVVGGESGPNARPMQVEWARSLKDQCAAAGVPFFMKQGSAANWQNFKDVESFPEDLRVREYPDANSCTAR